MSTVNFRWFSFFLFLSFILLHSLFNVSFHNSFSILQSPDAGKSIACLQARHRPTVTIRLRSSVTFAFQMGWRWKDKFSLATDYRESNFTLDTWEKVKSKGHWRGSKYSTLVALIRNATARYWWLGSSDKVAILAEAGHRRHHTTIGQRSGPSTSPRARE